MGEFVCDRWLHKQRNIQLPCLLSLLIVISCTSSSDGRKNV